MEKMSGETLNIVKDNINKLKEIFPEIFNEDKVDFEKLQAVFGEYKDNGIERYNFTWPGKSKAIRMAQTPSTGTLRPCKEESKDWGKTGNLYIEGDNLEVLKILQKSYYGKIKVIYIDPPYNTGKDFVYKDDFKDNIENYLALTGQKSEEGNKLTTNTETNGRYHSNWLNMMYPRLKLARNLLKDDGVIFISIDDNEIDNLKKVCNEIFGEENFYANAIWHKKYAGANDAKKFSEVHDYVMIYSKSDIFSRNLLPRTDKQNSLYKYDSNDGKGNWRPDNLSVKSYSSKYDYPITNPNTNVSYNPPQGRCWLTNSETMSTWIKETRVFFGKDGKGAPQLKRYLSEVKDGVVPITYWSYDECGHTDEARKEIKSIFEQPPFDTPKPTRLIQRILQLATNKEDTVLDFFSGSSTTAHAVMKLNAEDCGNRKFIMIQLLEQTIGNSEARKAGFETICEIGKERIRRAGEKIKEENKNKEGRDDLDIGFKVFKLDSSNINKWDSSYEQDLESNLYSMVENIKTDRTEEDVLYEILLKYGIDLNTPIEEHLISGKKVFSIGFGSMFACLDFEITLEVVEGIGKLKEDLNPETCRVVFMDNGFSMDSVKSNAIQILKRFNIEDVKSI